MKKTVAILVLLLCAVMIYSGCATASRPPETADSADVKTQDIDRIDDQNDSDKQEPAQDVQAETGSSELIEPEQLISQEEAEALLGEPLVGEKTDNDAVGQKIYFYEAVDESSDQYLQIGVTQQAFMAEGSALSPQQLYESICAAFEPEPVSGLGDEAQEIPSGYQIMCDGYYLTVTAGYTSDDKAIISDASKTAVANLKALLGK